MEHFMAVFLGAWISLFGVFFMMALNKEYAGYEKTGGSASTDKNEGGA